MNLLKVPVIVRTATDQQVLELALIENLQRAELDAVEEADGYATLIETFGLKQEEVAEDLGQSLQSRSAGFSPHHPPYGLAVQQSVKSTVYFPRELPTHAQEKVLP